jgi:hypothetical protein
MIPLGLLIIVYLGGKAVNKNNIWFLKRQVSI